MQWIDEIPVWGQPDQGAVRQIKRVRDWGAARVALMADHHLGNSQPFVQFIQAPDVGASSGARSV
jgi:hypothetical protein